MWIFLFRKPLTVRTKDLAQQTNVAGSQENMQATFIYIKREDFSVRSILESMIAYYDSLEAFLRQSACIYLV